MIGETVNENDECSLVLMLTLTVNIQSSYQIVALIFALSLTSGFTFIDLVQLY